MTFYMIDLSLNYIKIHINQILSVLSEEKEIRRAALKIVFHNARSY